ncbi:DNA gyrase inhibitor YacG [Geomonas sp. RF6]|uniref:DNA gyrase inhibitor YacG n=1 Tax=Geomonas sp. RF6 TaxID=2897342 RepID=UPI001E459812|nr:DNA gyrase inhibitor YacG [Geomonas sp. RF6]UFS69864.1 DNA gyrase inhibitor YacG [Geomonas sp. RF6]
MTTPTIIRCPQCRKSTTLTNNPWRPFCSERCKMIDLGTWASEGYRVPGEKAPQSEDDDSDE